MIEFLVGVGATTSLLLAVGLIMVIFCLVKDWIGGLVWKYRYKHRFDRKPLAKCYCIDCEHYSKDFGKCYSEGFEYYPSEVKENHFCSLAEPRENPH